MSLFDALLLEPYLDPRDVWIARRTDGQRGSGTQSDPFDGSAVGTPEFAITSLSGSGREATAVVCPLDPGWRRYYAETLARYAREGFRVIWIEIGRASCRERV